MLISTLVDIIFRTYQSGRPKSTERTFLKQDIQQHVIISLGKNLMLAYYDSRGQDEYLEADYSSYSRLLSTMLFDLGDADFVCKRSADLGSYQFFNIPKNKNITNIYPVGEACGGRAVGEITQVAPSEENFYLRPDYKDYLFFVLKGNNIDTYNVPACIKKIKVEATFNVGDIDISTSIAFEIANYVLGMVIGIPGYANKTIDNNYSEPQKILKKNIQPSNEQI